VLNNSRFLLEISFLTKSLVSFTLLGFLFPIRSYPAAAQLLNVLNLPATDISFWQTTSPLDAVSDLLIRLRWSSIAVISQSKPALLTFSKKASERSICIVAQTVLSPINRQAIKQVQLENQFFKSRR
jgi:hypothetical protein